MAELTAFHFRAGASVLHGLDVRFKLACLILLSLSSLNAGLWALLMLTLGLAMILVHIRLPVRSVLKELRYFLILLAFVFMARALSTPGTLVIQFKILSVTRQGLSAGALICWRLALVVLMGLFLVFTTRPSEIRAAVGWFLSPFSFIPGKRIATMIGLILRFVPVILDQAKDTSDAQRARGIENRKNPVYRLIKLVIPLTRRTFESADRLALAMEARCYTENRTDPEFLSAKQDWIALVAAVCWSVLALKI